VPEFKAPGVYVEQVNPGMRPIQGVSTTVAAFLGFAESGPFAPTIIKSLGEYQSSFGGFAAPGCLPYAMQGFFENGGSGCYVLRLPSPTPRVNRANVAGSAIVTTKPTPVGASPKLTPLAPIVAAKALTPLEDLDDISIVCCPDEHSIAGMTAALVAHCEELRYRIAILAAPLGSDLSDAPPPEAQSSYAAYYAPWLRVANPNGGAAISVHPGGHVAGAMVANDGKRGVCKAPANLPIAGIVGLERQITDQEQFVLNPRGVNVLRTFPGRGNLIWGARTTSTDPEWKYINVRRYFIYLEKSIQQGTQWVLFEPNGEQLWANVRQTIENFLFNEWKSGALLGDKPDEAYFVRCDRTTMTQDDLDNGRLICLIGVAPLKPAEFVIFRIGQWTADAKATP
jgi:phage tail sheath protein FI